MLILWRDFDSLRRNHMRLIGDFIFLVLFFVLVVGWLLAWAAFHVAGGAIHLLLVLAVIFLVMHLFRGRSTV
jgi:polyferredoxin